MVLDPGSGKNSFRIPDPGVKKAPDPGSGSATLPTINLLTHFIYILDNSHSSLKQSQTTHLTPEQSINITAHLQRSG
jgi:hypothetical protein